jgi:hypothetical protein
MNYISEIDKGNKIICTYKKPLCDGLNNSWSKETWYKVSDDLYRCEYQGNDFVTNHDGEDTEFMFRDIVKMQINNEVDIEVVGEVCNKEGLNEYELYLKLKKKYLNE